MRGGRVDIATVAADAFGNALGQSLANSASSAMGSEQEDVLGKKIAELQQSPIWNAPGVPSDSAGAGTAPLYGVYGAPVQASFGDGTRTSGVFTGPTYSDQSYTIAKGDTVEALARANYGDNWRAGVAAIIDANGLQANRLGSPLLTVGNDLTIPDLQRYQDQGVGLDALSKMGGGIIAGNQRGIDAYNAWQEQQRVQAAQAQLASDAYREANRFAGFAADNQAYATQQASAASARTAAAYAATNAGALGITPAQVDASIAAGNTGVLDALSYAGRVTLYKAWDFVTGGFVERQDARIVANADGQLSDDNFLKATVTDAVGSVASIAVAGRVGGYVAGRIGGYAGAAATGAAAGGAYDLTQQATQNVTYAVTDGETGRNGVSLNEVGNSALFGAALGVGGKYLADYGNYNVRLNLGEPGTLYSNPLPLRLEAPEALAPNSVGELPLQEVGSPYFVRINPNTGVGPMAIDSSTFTSGPETMAGGIRNSKQFWNQWLDTYPNTLSRANVDLINEGLSPVVDNAWVAQFPEHAGYEGETLIHHHLDYGPNAIPLPRPVHSEQPGWGIWHPLHSGN